MSNSKGRININTGSKEKLNNPRETAKRLYCPKYISKNKEKLI